MQEKKTTEGWAQCAVSTLPLAEGQPFVSRKWDSEIHGGKNVPRDACEIKDILFSRPAVRYIWGREAKGSSETKRSTFPEDASLLVCWPLLDQQWHPVAKSLSTDFFVSRKGFHCFGWSGNSEQSYFWRLWLRVPKDTVLCNIKWRTKGYKEEMEGAA